MGNRIAPALPKCFDRGEAKRGAWGRRAAVDPGGEQHLDQGIGRWVDLEQASGLNLAVIRDLVGPEDRLKAALDAVQQSDPMAERLGLDQRRDLGSL